MDVIKTWLRSARNYAVGVRLYLEFGDDAVFKRLLQAEAETHYKREQLLKRLTALSKNAPPAPPEAQAPQVEQAAATLATFKKTWPEIACKSPDEKKLWEQAVVLLKERAHLHSTLLHLPDDDARRAVAFQLLRKDDELTAIYDQRKYFLQYGKLPEAESSAPEYVTDPFLMAKRIENLSRNIRRVTNPDRKAELVAEYNHYARLQGKKELAC